MKYGEQPAGFELLLDLKLNFQNWTNIAISKHE
jgi:hypothetical protein